MGQFGPELCVRLKEPFLQLVAGIGVRGAFQRLEAVAAALWVLADLTLTGLLLFACRAMGRDLLPKRWAKAVPCAAAAAAFAGGLWLFPDGDAARAAAEYWIPAGNLFFLIFFPIMMIFLKKGKKE